MDKPKASMEMLDKFTHNEPFTPEEEEAAVEEPPMMIVKWTEARRGLGEKRRFQ